MKLPILKDQNISEVEENLFKDPYEPYIAFKIISLICYLTILSECIILGAFVYYESKGFAGPKRTVINILVSHQHALVRPSKIKCNI